jgi:phospholipid/cholesterol/gamma-HCH transport system substrate-binding protein
MKRAWNVELATGIFLILGLLALGYLSVKMARLDVTGRGGYTVYAVFSSVEGLKPGAVVEIAGVEVGRVKSITLEDYQAKVELTIRNGIKIPKDTIVSIRTKGLLGEKYIKLNPGGSETYIPAGGEILETEAPINLEELIANFIFGKI